MPFSPPPAPPLVEPVTDPVTLARIAALLLASRATGTTEDDPSA
ncbi:MAG: hypothetical protein WD651_06565 [Acidimicrobiia bacterium]